MTDRIEDAYRHCARITRAEAKNFYYAFLLLPAPKRRAMYALYAFCRRADDIVDEPGAPADKRDALARLRADLDACWNGAPRFPLFTALHDVHTRFGLERRYLEEVIEGCAMDLEVSRYPNWDALCRYLDLVATSVGCATMQILGVDPRTLPRYAHAGGRSVQLTNIIRDVREDAERDRIYLPLDELEAAGVREQDLLCRETCPALRRLLHEQVQRARSLYAEARAALPPAPRRRLTPLLAISRIYESLLDRIAREDCRVLERRHRLPTWKKLTLTLPFFVTR